MSSGRKRSAGGKAKIEVSKPEAPAFLQRIREQIAAGEDEERRQQGQKKRKEREQRYGPERVADEDEPAIVKLADGDIDEQEYRRMKLDLETKYRLGSESASKRTSVLDIDDLLGPAKQSAGAAAKAAKEATPDRRKLMSKKITYGSSDEEDGDNIE